jgi:hypothetical protein
MDWSDMEHSDWVQLMTKWKHRRTETHISSNNDDSFEEEHFVIERHHDTMEPSVATRAKHMVQTLRKVHTSADFALGRFPIAPTGGYPSFVAGQTVDIYWYAGSSMNGQTFTMELYINDGYTYDTLISSIVSTAVHDLRSNLFLRQASNFLLRRYHLQFQQEPAVIVISIISMPISEVV